MAYEKRAPHETLMALFWARLAAQTAAEPYVTAERIVAALSRTRAFREFCSRANIHAASLPAAADRSGALSFDECKWAIRLEMVRSGLPFASKEHRDRVEKRPVDPAIKHVFDKIIEQPRQFLGTTPLELLLELIASDEALAARLETFGLTQESLKAAVENQ